MTELMNIEQSLNGLGTGLDTMTPAKIAKISDKMVEVDRANKTLGRRNTQTTNQLMTLTMLTDSPYRRLRQCLAQIESKRLSLEDAYFRYEKTKLKIKRWEEKGDELSLLLIQEALHKQERSKQYIEGALKEIAVFQDAYDEIRESHNIPENWDEKDAEEDEIRHHIRQAFRQAHRDMILTGHITQGNAEYMEQYGVHLQTAQRIIKDYIQNCEDMMNEGKMPSVEHLYLFLDDMVAHFYDAHKLVMEHIGLKTLIRDDYLYLEEAKSDGA